MVIQLKKNADVNDLIEQMHEFFDIHAEQAKIFAKSFDLGSCVENSFAVWLYLKTLRYKADQKKQIIQTPYRLSRTKQGDCKSYSIFAAATLAALGNSVRFVYTCNDFNGMWHVYSQIKCSYNIITIDGTINEFDFEAPANYKFVGPWMQLQ